LVEFENIIVAIVRLVLLTAVARSRAPTWWVGAASRPVRSAGARVWLQQRIGLKKYGEFMRMNETIIGIIGTLLGTIVGFFLNELNKIGTLKTTCITHQDLSGTFKVLPTAKAYYEVKYIQSFDVYNSASDTRIMSDISFEISKNNKPIKIIKAAEINISNLNNNVVRSTVANNANFPPKQICRLIVSCSEQIKDASLELQIKDRNQLFLTYKNERGRVKRIKIDT